jgi:hypothetical protein
MTREEAIKILKSMSDISTQGEAIDIAIEALSAPSGDLISRADAIKAMWKALYAYEDLTEKQFMEHEELELKDWFQHRIFVQRMHEECMKAVESLPSAEAVQRWIPCSERLPSEYGKYLVFYEGTIIGSNIEIMRYGEPLMPNVDVSGKHFYRSDGEWGDIIYDEVIAWMPLPTPYKE